MFRLINVKWSSKATWIIVKKKPKHWVNPKMITYYLLPGAVNCYVISTRILYIILFLPRWAVQEVRALCLHLWDEKVKTLYSPHPGEAPVHRRWSHQRKQKGKKAFNPLPAQDRDGSGNWDVSPREVSGKVVAWILWGLWSSKFLAYLLKEIWQTMFLLVFLKVICKMFHLKFK